MSKDQAKAGAAGSCNRIAGKIEETRHERGNITIVRTQMENGTRITYMSGDDKNAQAEGSQSMKR